MDRISLLPDDLILKILSFTETTVAVETSLLSKRWRSLWKFVPKLEYVAVYYTKTSRFIDNFLLLHKSPVLETLHLTCTYVRRVDIESCVSVGVARGLRNLSLLQYGPFPIRFPSILFTCETLVVLHLRWVRIVDVPSRIRFQSLKILLLSFVLFSSDEIVEKFLSSCSVLEALTVSHCFKGNVKTITVSIPSLKKLDTSDFAVGYRVKRDDLRFIINVPSLKSLNVVNRVVRWCWLQDMPELMRAELNLRHVESNKLLGCLTSVKCISLCLKPPLDLNSRCVFNNLVSLELCFECSSNWYRLMLKHSPKLKVLRFIQRDCSNSSYVQTQLEQPNCVPECLETVKFDGYKGSEVEKEVVMYLLENGNFLEKITLKPLFPMSLEERQKTLTDFSSKPWSSAKCKLYFEV